MDRIVNKFTWKMGGEAGFGVNSSGLLFTRLCMRYGLYAFEYSEYPSLVRGGHQTSQVSVDSAAITSEHYKIDLLVALNKQSIELHKDELSNGSAVIYDSAQFSLSAPEDLLGRKSSQVILLGVPLTQIAIDCANLNLLRNTVSLGASLALLGGDIIPLFALIDEEFSRKEPEVSQMNKQAIQQGYDYVMQHYGGLVEAYKYKMQKVVNDEMRMTISGNEAMGIGAIRGGLEFYGGYPMTPSSTLLGFMAANQYDYGIVVKHAEDEIAVVNMTIGASFAGARAMCATSGGGFALMEEGIGLAAITETPLVVVDVQRPGPATGLPTWTDQGDLRFVLHSAQGEFFRVVIAPGDMDECYRSTQVALNMSEKYQIPVIVLSDKWLAECHAVVSTFDPAAVRLERGKLILSDDQIASYNTITSDKGIYGRYLPSNDGVSPRTVPGVKDGVYLANSDEHEEHGYTSEEIDVRIDQVDKRMLKLPHVLKELPEPIIYGNEFSSILLIGWGSVKGPVLEALKMVQEELDTSVAFMHVMYVWPFHTDAIKSALTRYRRIIIVENNSTAQLAGLIAEMTGALIAEKWLKYDGRPFWPEELKDKIVNVIQLKG
ncbi:MAG: 2-oxoacid:acceptor oxidoreductase subunit alpha [bacterium]|nr:2-oxoacid:acceptor oxidoreductase subunit alpha [bacterium]